MLESADVEVSEVDVEEASGSSDSVVIVANVKEVSMITSDSTVADKCA